METALLSVCSELVLITVHGEGVVSRFLAAIGARKSYQANEMTEDGTGPQPHLLYIREELQPGWSDTCLSVSACSVIYDVGHLKESDMIVFSC